MRRFKTDNGSAVVEFVLVILPFALLLANQLSWFADSLQRTTLRSIAVESARFAALADVTQRQALEHLNSRITNFSQVKTEVQFGSVVKVKITWPSRQLFQLSPKQLQVQSYAKHETD